MAILNVTHLTNQVGLKNIPDQRIRDLVSAAILDSIHDEFDEVSLHGVLANLTQAELEIRKVINRVKEIKESIPNG